MSIKPPHALVTGSSGFVGSHLVRILAERGWRLTAVSRELREVPPNGVTTVCLPLMGNVSGWQQAFDSVQCVVHLAACAHQVRPSARTASTFREVNVDGARFVAERAASAGVRRFVFVSSIKVNGEGENDRQYRASDDPKPQDDYARSKLDAELMLKEVCLRNSMELTIIRPPLVYGPGVRANFQRLMRLTNLGIPLPLGSIANRRSLIGVWNLVDFIETCMKNPHAAGRTWLVADGEDLSTPALIRKLALLMRVRTSLFSVSPAILRGVANSFGFGKEMSRLCDSLLIDLEPVREQLHWRAPVDVDTGLARTVAAYLQAPR
jgi:nucleoside-diphosphate-sugar epimerase